MWQLSRRMCAVILLNLKLGQPLGNPCLPGVSLGASWGGVGGSGGVGTEHRFREMRTKEHVLFSCEEQRPLV